MDLAKALDELKIASPVSADQVREAFDRGVRRVQAEGRTSLKKRGEIPSRLADLAEARQTCLDELSKRGSSAPPSTASQLPFSTPPTRTQSTGARPYPSSKQAAFPPQAGSSPQRSHAGSPYPAASAAVPFPAQSTWSQPSSPGPVPVGWSSSQQPPVSYSQSATSSWRHPTQSFGRRSPFRHWNFWGVLRALVFLFFLFLLSLLPFALVRNGFQSLSGGSSKSSLFGLSRTAKGNGHAAGDLKSEPGSSDFDVDTPTPSQPRKHSNLPTVMPSEIPIAEPSPIIVDGPLMRETSRYIPSGYVSEVFAAADESVRMAFESVHGRFYVTLSPDYWTRIFLPLRPVTWEATFEGRSFAGVLRDDRLSGSYLLFFFAHEGRFEFQKIAREGLPLAPSPPQKEDDGPRAWLTQRSHKGGWETLEINPIGQMPTLSPSLVPSETPFPSFTPTPSPSPTSSYTATPTAGPSEERVAFANENHASPEEAINDCRLLGTADREVQLWVVLEEGVRLFHLGPDRVERFTLPAGKVALFALLDGKRVARHETTLQSGISYAVVVISKRWYMEVRMDESIAAYGERRSR